MQDTYFEGSSLPSLFINRIALEDGNAIFLTIPKFLK